MRSDLCISNPSGVDEQYISVLGIASVQACHGCFEAVEDPILSLVALLETRQYLRLYVLASQPITPPLQMKRSRRTNKGTVDTVVAFVKATVLVSPAWSTRLHEGTTYIPVEHHCLAQEVRVVFAQVSVYECQLGTAVTSVRVGMGEGREQRQVVLL